MEFIVQFNLKNAYSRHILNIVKSRRPVIYGKKRSLGSDFIDEVRALFPNEDVSVNNIDSVLNCIEFIRLNIVIEPEIAIGLSVFKNTSFVKVDVLRPLNDFLYENINTNNHAQIKKEYVIDYDGIKEAWLLDDYPLIWFRGSFCKNFLWNFMEFIK